MNNHDRILPSQYGGITSTNDISLNPLVNGEYANVTSDMNQSLHTLGYMRINIYTDLSGNFPALDTLGNPIVARNITGTTYVYPHLSMEADPSGIVIDGYMTFFFDDGSSFSNYDLSNSSYTYLFENLNPPVIKYLT